MKLEYLVEGIYKNGVEREKRFLTASLKHWLRNAKLDEEDGCIVDLTFKYLPKFGLIMTNYVSTDLKNGCQEKVSLINKTL